MLAVRATMNGARVVLGHVEEPLAEVDYRFIATERAPASSTFSGVGAPTAYR